MTSAIETYIWKDKRLTKNKEEKQVSYRLIDTDEYTLNSMYKHCKDMLYSTDPNHLGRIIILEEIKKQLNYCGAELALRYFKELKDINNQYIYTEENLLSDLRTWVKVKQSNEIQRDSFYLDELIQVPSYIKKVNTSDLILACRDALPIFDHSKITFSFIYKLGIYFTEKELQNLNIHLSTSTLKDKILEIKHQLGLYDENPININPSGLSEAQFRDMIRMKKFKNFKKCKYSELSTSQLETLRNKVLYALEERIMNQISIWQTLMKQIEEVAEYKNYQLT
jgi:hypothetical protein